MRANIIFHTEMSFDCNSKCYCEDFYRKVQRVQRVKLRLDVK